MKYGEKIATVRVLGIDLIIYSNGTTSTISEEFSYNKKGIKLGMNYQCVQLVRKFYYELTGKDSYRICPDLHATCWFRWREKLGLEEIMFNSIQEGDIVVFSGGKFGHIGLVSEVVEEGFYLVQQNFFNDKRDINWFISFDSVMKNDGFFDQNGEKFILEDFLKIK